MIVDQTTTGRAILTVEQVAQELQVTPQTIRNWIKAGALPAIQIGKGYRIRREDVDDLISRQQSESGQMGTHRDPWAPETLGVPYRPRTATGPASVWDGTSSPITTPRRP